MRKSHKDVWVLLDNQKVKEESTEVYYNPKTMQIEGGVEMVDKGIAKSIMNKIIYGTTIPEQEKHDRHIQK